MNEANVSALRAATAGAAAGAAAAVEDTITSKTTETITETKPGFFTRAANRINAAIDNNPIKTAVVVSLGTGAAILGGVNYNRYGSALGTQPSNRDLAEVASAAVSFFSGLR